MGTNKFGLRCEPVAGCKSVNCRKMSELDQAIVWIAGMVVSRVLYTKQPREKQLLHQHAAMNDLIMPYDSCSSLLPAVAKLTRILFTHRWNWKRIAQAGAARPAHH
jgi:hypothetical protein